MNRPPRRSVGERLGELAQHLAVDAPHPHGREQALEDAADPAGAIPRALDRDLAAVGRGGHLPGRHERLSLIGLLEAAGALVDVQAIVALTPAGGEVVGVDGALALAALLHAVGAVVLGEDPLARLPVVTQELHHALWSG